MASPGTDIAFNVARTEGYRAFANKIWNAARFIFMNVNRAQEAGVRVESSWFTTPPQLSNTSPIEELWIMSRLNRTAHDVNLALEKYRFDDAANFIYQFFWGEFCDWYLEIVKLRLNFGETDDNSTAVNALATLLYVFDSSLRMLSPIMPFITEEIWHSLRDGSPPAKSIALTRYPVGDRNNVDNEVLLEMGQLKNLIEELRSIRKDLSVPDSEAVPGYVLDVNIGRASHNPVENLWGPITSAGRLISRNAQIVERLARVRPIQLVGSQERFGTLSDLFWRQGMFDLAIAYEKKIDATAERERLTRDIAKYEKGLAAAERQLGNEGFLAKAPAHVVEGLKRQEAETRLLLEKARAALAALFPE
jgi:valyl-tRNA synthetase